MATNDLYQSKFMPIFQKAETKIKLLILAAFLFSESLTSLRNKIDGVIAWVGKQIPKELNDKSAYIRGLKVSSERFILLYYKKPQIAYRTAKQALLNSVPKDIKTPKIENPQQLFNFISDPKKMWAEAKATPNVINYPRELKRRIEQMAQQPVVTHEPGKKPISLWQKAELDVRYEGQIKMLDELREQGVEYAWTSSHPDCSKRCEPWQGKLMDLTNHAKGPNHQVTTIDGIPVYSLVDIMAKTDKYGYNNNIICGFNCRHKLIPYVKGRYGPKEYTEKDVAKQRAIEERIRVMEREIRKLKTNEILSLKIGDMKSAKAYKAQWKALFAQYKAYCEHNGYAWNAYRINVY